MHITVHILSLETLTYRDSIVKLTSSLRDHFNRLAVQQRRTYTAIAHGILSGRYQ